MTRQWCRKIRRKRLQETSWKSLQLKPVVPTDLPTVSRNAQAGLSTALHFSSSAFRPHRVGEKKNEKNRTA